MIRIADSVQLVFDRIVAKFPDNEDYTVSDATDEALALIRKLPGYSWSGEFVEKWIYAAVREKIYQMRCASNRVNKGRFTRSTNAKVIVGDAKTEGQIRNVYNIYIAGRVLGMLKGSELAELEKDERDKGNGYYRNAYVLHCLQKIVKPNQTVKQAVSQKRLRAIIDRSKREAVHC